MPVSSKLHSELSLIEVRYFGVVTLEEAFENFAAFILSGQPLPGRVLIDTSEGDRLGFDLWHLPALARLKFSMIEDGTPRLETSIYAPRSQFYLAAQAYSKVVARSKKQRVTVHRDRAAALAALDLTVEQMARATAPQPSQPA